MILVTGGSGLLGSHLINSLVSKGKAVRAIKRPSSDLTYFYTLFPHLQSSEYLQWVIGDVLDVFSIEEALVDVEEVYHCAGAVSFNSSDKTRVLKVNVDGTANVINASLTAEVKKFCHVSSVAALGRTEGKLIDEQDDWKSDLSGSVYSLSKFGAEREAWRGIAEGLNVVIVNPTIILGPACWKNGSAAIFRNIDKGLRYYTGGGNGFVDVNDVVNVMQELMEKEMFNERFLINGENVSYQQLFSWIAEALKKPSPSIKVSKTFSEIIWRVEKARSLLLKTKPFITKESARTANRTSHFSNEKALTKLNYKFTPIKESVINTSRLYEKTKEVTC